MTRLVKDLWEEGTSFFYGLFGLCGGQTRSDDMVHNGAWYNKAGEKMGRGDLSPEDFQRISRELEEGEMFIVLYDSNFPATISCGCHPTASKCPIKYDEQASGVDYIARKCLYIIVPGHFYWVEDERFSQEPTYIYHGLTFEILDREMVKKFITG